MGQATATGGRRDGSLPGPQTQSVSHSLHKHFTVSDDSCHFLTPQTPAYPLLKRYPVEAL